MIDPEALYWVCDNCGVVEPAIEPYEYGDWEPCIYCEDHIACVVTGYELDK